MLSILHFAAKIDNWSNAIITNSHVKKADLKKAEKESEWDWKFIFLMPKWKDGKYARKKKVLFRKTWKKLKLKKENLKLKLSKSNQGKGEG